MPNNVSATGKKSAWRAEAWSLYAPGGGGQRKYLNHAERQRALAAMAQLEPDQALFALTLAWSGARITEVLSLTPASFQTEAGIVAIRTLKRCKHSMREVPLPPFLMAALDRHFGLVRMQRNPETAFRRLWPWSRVTGWRLIKRVMRRCDIVGRSACPRGLRHSVGVHTLQTGVPLNITQRWLGHARISTTAIYADASGPEERAFAERFWRSSNNKTEAL